MVKVIYVNDVEYSLEGQTIESLKEWPASKLMEYFIKPELLTENDLKEIATSEYLNFIKKHNEEDKDYVSNVNKEFVKRNIFIMTILTIIGFLPFYYISLLPIIESSSIYAENNYQYLTAIYFTSSISFYFGASFMITALLQATMMSRLTKSGRRLYKKELLSGLYFRSVYVWIVISIIVQITCYGLSYLMTL